MRRRRRSLGTGGDTLSYSLQYPQSMLQRRIGMICTSSGCAVCTSPRTNSRKDRALRCAVVSGANPKIIASARGRLGRSQALHPLTELQRAVEDGPDGDEPEEVM